MSGVEFYSENEEPTSNSIATNSMVQQQAPEVKQSNKKTYVMVTIIFLAIAASVFVFLKYSVFKKNTNFANEYKNVNQTLFIPKKTTE